MEKQEINQKLVWTLKSLISEIQSKNPISMAFKLIHIGSEISESLNWFINKIQLDENISNHTMIWIAYDLFWEEKIDEFKKTKDFNSLISDIESFQSWVSRGYVAWVLSVDSEIFKKPEKTQKEILTLYYLKKDEYSHFRLSDWELILSDSYIEKIRSQYSLKDSLRAILKVNLNPNLMESDGLRCEYLKKINEFENVICDSSCLDKLLDENNLDFLLNNDEIKEIVSEYMERKISASILWELRLWRLKIDKKFESFKEKEVILNFYELKDFIVSIYSSPILSIFSNMIINKFSLKSKKDLLFDNDYKLLKYFVTYVCPINDIEGLYVRKFFEDFEKNFNSTMKIQKMSIFRNMFALVFVSNIFLIFLDFLFFESNFLDVILAVDILFIILYFVYLLSNFKNIVLWLLVSILWIFAFNFDFSSLKTSLLDSGAKDNTSFIVLDFNNLYFDWEKRLILSDYYLWNAVWEVMSRYSELWINFSWKQKVKIISEISWEYLWDLDSENLPYWYEIDLGEIEKIFLQKIKSDL